MVKDIKTKKKYRLTAYFYDVLDWPWEFFVYKRMRADLLLGISGSVLELGVGTGRNLQYYAKNVELTGIDISRQMLRKAKVRAKDQKCVCHVNLIEADAILLDSIKDSCFDWVVSTFLFCVMPDRYQVQAISHMARVLKPGGKFKIVEIVYSKKKSIYFKQKLMSCYVHKVFGAKFNRKTLEIIQTNPTLKIDNISYVKDDTYLLIEGSKI